jgi:hypothetical protein
VSTIYDWATAGNLQPEPITVEIWRQLPEDFCRQVEVVNGQAIRGDTPSRPHQAATCRIATLLEAAATEYVELHPGACLDVSHSWRVPPLPHADPGR